jgi:XRE family aerobic/anaerobic benzoate catabolism transcriptional regulator
MKTASPSPDDLLQQVGTRVRQAREARGESRAALAARSGVSLRFLAELESGTANISLLRLHEVAQALGLGLPALLGGSPGPPPDPAPERRDLDALLDPRSPAELRETRDWLATRFGSGRPLRVALLGLRGAGKSTVGRRLARALRVPFFELDALIEAAAGLPLAQIFELQGEAYYRRLERVTLEQFLEEHPAAVLATGGGVVTAPETYALLRRGCTTVWLRAEPGLHWQRVVQQGDRRPMQNNPAAMQELRTLLAARAPLYAQAHVTLDTSGRTAAQVAVELLERVQRPEPAVRKRPRPARK